MVDDRDEIRHHAHSGSSGDYQNVPGALRNREGDRQRKSEDECRECHMPNPFRSQKSLGNPAVDCMPRRKLEHRVSYSQIHCTQIKSPTS